jgi:hypothetical protein
MTDELKEITLGGIIDDLVASEQTIDAAALARWIKRYPQYERELMDFAARWSLLTHLPPDESPLSDEAGFYARGLEAVRKVFDASKPRSNQGAEPLAGILAEGQRHGLNISKIAALADLSVPIIAKFEQRLIAFSSIPREAIAGVARAIQTSVENVAAYLQGSHNFVPGASYKSDTAPTLPPQQDFQDAVRDDRTLSDEKKRRWLEVASRPGNSQ